MADHLEGSEETDRTTSPMSEFTTRQLVVGFVVALIGMAIVFGVPLLLV